MLAVVACVIIKDAQLVRVDPNVFRYFYFFLLKRVPPINVYASVYNAHYTRQYASVL